MCSYSAIELGYPVCQWSLLPLAGATAQEISPTQPISGESIAGSKEETDGDC